MIGKWIVGVAAAVALCSMLDMARAQGNDANRAQGNDANKAFMMEAMQGDLSEIEVGKLAQQKGGSEKTKQFGQKLTEDHSANLEKAKTLAQSIGVPVPNSPNAEQKTIYEKLSKLSGAQFDRQFAQDMVQDHQNDISKFQEESQKSGPVADFAKQTLPALKEHLQLAQSLAGSTTGAAEQTPPPSRQQSQNAGDQTQQNQNATQTQNQQNNAGQSQTAHMNLDRSQIEKVQHALDQKGFKAGRADGVLGPETEAALRSFQQDQKLQATGQIDEQTLAALGLKDTQEPSSVGQGGQSSDGRQQAGSKN